METWWSTLDAYQQFLWAIAIPATIVLFGQTLLTFAGIDATDGVEADFSGDLDTDTAPFQLFTIRNFINFLLGFSWGGIAFYEIVPNKIALALVATLIGAALVAMMMLIFKMTSKLDQDNTMQIDNAVGKSADVYLLIPGHRNGKGKVQIVIQKSVHELDAVTEGDTLPTGTLVRVKEVLEGKLLVVEKI